MSPPPHPQQKKKKKGRAPAHQNTFAFRHNPGSKKTDVILASPISGCCRRCHDKLIWRKQYRRYKPLTQPAICTVCHGRKIRSAYHTRCADCRGNLCAVCGKEPPIGLDEQEHESVAHDNIHSTGKKLTLRQRKALERQEANNIPRSKARRGGADVAAMEQSSEASAEDEMDAMMDPAETDTQEDPFLQAIGGAFVTGDAYREKLLQQQGNTNSTASMEDN